MQMKRIYKWLMIENTENVVKKERKFIDEHPMKTKRETSHWN